MHMHSTDFCKLDDRCLVQFNLQLVAKHTYVPRLYHRMSVVDTETKHITKCSNGITSTAVTEIAELEQQ